MGSVASVANKFRKNVLIMKKKKNGDNIFQTIPSLQRVKIKYTSTSESTEEV